MDHTLHLPLLFLTADEGLDLSRELFLPLCHLTRCWWQLLWLSKNPTKECKMGGLSRLANLTAEALPDRSHQLFPDERGLQKSRPAGEPELRTFQLVKIN